MTKKRVLLSCLLGPVLLCGGVLLAQKPAQNVSPKRHPNLAAAQRLSEQAFQKVTAAQQANEWDMNGPRGKSERAARTGKQRTKAGRYRGESQPQVNSSSTNLRRFWHRGDTCARPICCCASEV